MAEQEIRINIAGRYYAMYITPDQEEIIRRIGKSIDQMIREIEANYATKDKQDALAMTALRLITDAEFALKKMEKKIENSNQKLKEIIALLEDLEEGKSIEE